MSTTIAARMRRLGRPSVFVPIAIVAALILGALLLVLPRFGTPGAYEGGEAGPQANVPREGHIDGQGPEPDGIGGAADPGAFEDAPTPLAEDSPANATSATPGDEMMDLPRDPPPEGGDDARGDEARGDDARGDDDAASDGSASGDGANGAAEPEAEE